MLGVGIISAQSLASNLNNDRVHILELKARTAWPSIIGASLYTDNTFSVLHQRAL